MIKLTFELYPEDGRIKPYDHPYGYIFRGVIMEWLKNIKPELVHQLHEYEEIRPYSINCKIDKKIPKINFILVSYNEVLSDTLLEDLLSNEKVKLRIGEKNYFISRVKFERLNFRTFLEQAKPVKVFSLNFVKSAYFNTSMGDYPVRFPIPNLLFGNLVNIWNDILRSEAGIDRETFINWVNAHVYVSGHKMRTVRTDIGKPKPVVGFLGNASFKVTKINKNYYKHFLIKLNREYDYEFVNEDYSNNCRWLEILCRLGEYTNVGANRTAGMGVIRYYSKFYLSEKDLLVK